MCSEETETQPRRTRWVSALRVSIFKLFLNGLNSPRPKIMRISSEADPPPAYSRRGSDSEAESSPADQPPSYTRARLDFWLDSMRIVKPIRTLSEGDETCSWPTPSQVEQMTRESEEDQGCCEGES